MAPKTSSTPKIRIRNLGKYFNLPKGNCLMVMDDINLDIAEGDFVMILGESGCGKSTLLNMLAGFMAPSTGEIRIDDKPVNGLQPSIYMLFQQPSLLPWLTVEENISFGCRIRGETARLDYRVNEFIEMIGLSGFEGSYPAELSMGMSYRVALARALIGRPDILLLDEPFGALDTFTRTRLQEELINLWMVENFTTVFVTHDIDEAVLLGNKVMLLGGHPCRIHDFVEIDAEYPRKITDESFFHTRTMVLKKFKKVFHQEGLKYAGP